LTEVDCVFCAIVAGSSPASMLYGDEQVVAFLDIRPVNAGHLLVVPRVHAALLSELAPVIGGRLFQVGMALDQALRCSGVRCDDVNLYLADGAVAGQEVPHVHLHVVPRFRGDGFGLRLPAGYGRRPEREALEEIAGWIRRALGEVEDAR